MTNIFAKCHCKTFKSFSVKICESLIQILEKSGVLDSDNRSPNNQQNLCVLNYDLEQNKIFPFWDVFKEIANER